MPTLFFFSSRRRHTRFDCDWSSDVCSSDLQGFEAGGVNPALVDGEHVTGPPSDEDSSSASRLERFANLGNSGLESVLAGRLIAPEVVKQTFGRHNPARGAG